MNKNISTSARNQVSMLENWNFWSEIFFFWLMSFRRNNIKLVDVCNRGQVINNNRLKTAGDIWFKIFALSFTG